MLEELAKLLNDLIEVSPTNRMMVHNMLVQVYRAPLIDGDSHRHHTEEDYPEDLIVNEIDPLKFTLLGILNTAVVRASKSAGAEDRRLFAVVSNKEDEGPSGFLMRVEVKPYRG